MTKLDALLSPKRLVIGFGLLTVVMLVIAASTSTAAFGIYNNAWDGTAELQDIAETTGATTTIARETTAYTQSTPTETLSVILSPDQPYSQEDRQQIESYVRNGGTLVVADDYGSHTNGLLSDLGAEARLDGQPLRDEQFNYRSPAMPVANNVTNHSTVDNVSSVTLNHGTAVNPNNASVLVSTSHYAYLDTNQNQSLDASETVGSYPVVTTEQLGQGTIIVVGDPSLFINAMIEKSGNRVFAHSLFAGHSHVVLDYSHTASLPPLAVALLLLRDSLLLQFLIGVGGTLAVFIVLQTDGLMRLKRRVTRTQSQPAAIEVTETDLVTHLRKEYPDWDDERIQRVVTARRKAPDTETQQE
ncbi:DUF4350 domain-containing protein [Halorussus salinisoli]|uniref:DUF4350 domain-containing protein n=1 Tax=Halorussus salinisoli TaxID=2558242 RepID=UPI002A908C69|nr:DUF4350 domain-containing protein [Halorussus salinisoli]